MSIKKEMAKSVVFASVFAGTLISEGISFVTIAEPSKKAAEKVKHTVKNMKADIQERFHLATARIIEESALINGRIKSGDLAVLVQAAKISFKDAYAHAKAKYANRT